MNFIFSPYPTHDWISDWTLETSNCTTSYRESFCDHFFKTLETVGQLAPNAGNPAWALQVPVPQNSGVHLLANGFCAYFERKKLRCGAEVFMPEPGVLWGRFLNIPAPVLLTGTEGRSENGIHWVESEETSALLMVKNNSFCLITKSHVQSEAEHLACSYLEKNLESFIQKEYSRRSGAIALLEEMSHHDSLAAICVESMFKALRPAEGRIPHIWSQSSGITEPQFDINELFPLAHAWSLIDPEKAEELILCALKIQTNAGAMPVHFAPHTTYSVLEAPKPLMCQTAERVWETRKNPEFLSAILPALRRHLQWMLHHFDPKRRKVYSWKSKNETIVPDLYQTDLSTVDLSTLILAEIEALNRLREASATHFTHPPYFDDEKQQLEQNISEQFWNNEDNAFSNALLRENIISLRGFPERVPLLLHDLPLHQKSAILDNLHQSETLPGKKNALSWSKSSLSDESYPLLQNFLIFQGLKIAEPHGNILSDFSRATIQGFVEWHTLSIESTKTIQINSAIASYILNVQALHKYRYHAKGAVTGLLFRVLRKVRADRTDLMVIAGTLIILFCVHSYYGVRDTPPPKDVLETQLNSAYAEWNLTNTLAACRSLIKYYPEDAAMARLLTSNILMINGNYGEAAELLEKVRADYSDSPGAMVSLGIAYQLLGEFEKADGNYYEFCYLFDEIFPNVVKEVSSFRYLMQEGFNTPPKWKEIYRYQFMHEL